MKEAGFFDLVDMDALTAFVLEKKKCENIWELINLLTPKA